MDGMNKAMPQKIIESVEDDDMDVLMKCRTKGQRYSGDSRQGCNRIERKGRGIVSTETNGVEMLPTMMKQIFYLR